MVLPSLLPTRPRPAHIPSTNSWFAPDHTTLTLVWLYLLASRHSDFDYEYILKSLDKNNSMPMSWPETLRPRFELYAQRHRLGFWRRRLHRAGPWAVEELHELEEFKRATGARMGMRGRLIMIQDGVTRWRGGRVLVKCTFEATVQVRQW